MADVEATVDIAADADAVYRIVTDLPTMARTGGGGDGDAVGERRHRAAPVRSSRAPTATAAKSWSTTCTVTDAEPGRVFAFDVRSAVVPVAHWRYDIVATDDGCRVTERTWDRRPGWFRIPAGWATGVKDRKAANAEHIAQTLERLKAKAERRV